MLSIGIAEDKPSTGLIIEETGVGIYHYVESIAVEQAKASIQKILTDVTYKKNAKRFREIYTHYDPVEKLDHIIRRETKKFDEFST